jgi:hypothetical protein
MKKVLPQVHVFWGRNCSGLLNDVCRMGLDLCFSNHGGNDLVGEKKELLLSKFLVLPLSF